MSEQHTSAYHSGGSGRGQPHGETRPRDRLDLVLAALAALHLAAVHLDTVRVQHAAGSAPGLRNLVVAVLLPTLLASLSVRSVGTARFSGQLVALFGALSLYASAAGCWSPYPDAAIKQAAYLWSYGCLLVAYRTLASLHRPSLIWGAAWCSTAGVLLASVQTVCFNNHFGATAHRFTSFVSPQSFGLSLAVLFGLLLHGSRSRLVDSRIVVALAATVAVAGLLNGGRQGFLTIVVLAAASLIPTRERSLRRTLLLPLTVLLAATGLTFALRMAAPEPLRALAEEHRALDLVSFTSSSLYESGDSGTFRDRLKIYAALARRITDSTVSEFVFGRGTSAAAAVIVEGDVEYRNYNADTVDPNRTAHNEFLRSLYEWGVIGFSLFTCLIGAVSWRAWRNFQRRGTSGDLLLFATALVALLGYSTFENLLAATSGPLGAALALLCAEIETHRGEYVA